MILFILTLFAQAGETQITEIDFESIELQAEFKKPRFQYIAEQKRPQFKPLSLEYIIEPTFAIQTKKDISRK